MSRVLNIFSGTAIQGGIIGGACAAAAYLSRTNQPFLLLCDALAPAGALAQAITRLGCLAAGCCYGRPTSLCIGIVYSDAAIDPTVPRGVPLHPVQLYEAFLDAGLALWLQRRLSDQRRPGRLFALYVIGTSSIRFAIEFFRGDDSGRLIWGLAHSQFMAIAMLAAAAALYACARQRKEEIA